MICSDEEFIEVFTLTEDRTGYPRVSDHLPIITRVHVDIEQLAEDTANVKEVYEEDKWKFNPEKVETVNNRVSELLENILQETKREETDTRLRSTIKGITKIFNKEMPKKMVKKKGIYKLTEERRLKIELRDVNKKKKKDLRRTMKDWGRISLLYERQKELLGKIYDIYKKRKEFEIQRMRHLISRNPDSVFDMIKANKERTNTFPQKMKIKEEWYRGQEQV